MLRCSVLTWGHDRVPGAVWRHVTVERMVPEFANEPFTDFSIPAQRQAMEAALRRGQG